MKQKFAQAKLLKRRIRQVQGRAKIAGLIYLMGTIALLVCAACILGAVGTCLSAEKAGGIVFPIKSFYQPLVDVFSGKVAWSAQSITDCIVVGLYACMLCVIIYYLCKSFAKLNWLFKRRASYINGFNRNMYAMDAMAKGYSRSLMAMVICGWFILLLSGSELETPTSGAGINMYAYIVLAVGIAIHFIGGIIGGKVTLFTFGKHIQEEIRPNGLFIHIIRNVVQIVAIMLISRAMMQDSVLLAGIQALLSSVLPGEGTAALDYMSLLPAAVELLAWTGLIGMTCYALSDKEFHREGMCAHTIGRFTVWALATAVALVVVLVLPMTGLVAAQAMSNYVLFAAIASGVAMLLDWIVRIQTVTVEDEVDVKTYLTKKDDEEEEDD